MFTSGKSIAEEAFHWLREGGLYLIVSGVVTVLKYLLLLFLPRAFAFLPMRDFGWPGIEMTLLGETFRWNISGMNAAGLCPP